MARRMMRIGRHSDMTQAAQQTREFIFTGADFSALAALLYQKAGIALGPNKQDMVYSRISRRLRALGMTAFEDYLHFLSAPDGADEMVECINSLTTNLTYFFREPHHFDHLSQTVLPTLLARGQKRIRIWSAGSSIGAEAYSIAMVLADALRGDKTIDARILATDIDTHVLEKGRAATYPLEDVNRIPERYQPYIKTNEELKNFQVKDPARSLVTFKPLNLLEDWPMNGPFDVIFCRNVVIYFDTPTQTALFNRFANLLAPGGYLYLGHSESMKEEVAPLKPCGKTMYQRSA